MISQDILNEIRILSASNVFEFFNVNIVKQLIELIDDQASTIKMINEENNRLLGLVSNTTAPDANVEANRKMLLERSQVGLKKYGTTTERTDLTKSQWLQHLIEELLDAANYAQRIKSIEDNCPIGEFKDIVNNYPTESGSYLCLFKFSDVFTWEVILYDKKSRNIFDPFQNVVKLAKIKEL